MFISHVFIVVNPVNADGNCSEDIMAAIIDAGASQVECGESSIIQATIPTHELAIINRMEGVSYIRPDITYWC
jgi:hypothetical protein